MAHRYGHTFILVHVYQPGLNYNRDPSDNQHERLDMVNETLEDLTRRISGLIPDNAKHLQQDVESNVRSLLQSGLSKMNLVTREEFDVQSAVLQRTREKLEQLEKQVEELTQSKT